MAFNTLRLILKSTELFINTSWFFIDFFLEEEQKIKRKLRKLKSRPIGKVKNGEYVKLIGKASRYDKLVAAPLSKRMCFGFQINVTRSGSNEANTGYIDEMRCFPFFIECDGGRALVMTKDARVFLEKDKFYNSGILKSSDNVIDNYLARHKTKAKSFGINKTLDFKEGIIELGGKVTVLGEAKETVLKSGERILLIKAGKKKPLFLSNYSSSKNN